ncbi:MAG: sugar ABC transporter ATP-binding protein [Bacillus subtilis]|nr:sugar ABC transporter ATP-binding protein [Bacillus subtilis]
MDYILEIDGISKSYGGIKALVDVSISCIKGEIHAIVGENGAGKSTLIKAVAGAIAFDSGSVIIAGNRYQRLNPKQSKALGIEVIYQEFNLIDSLSASENIFLGQKFGRFVNYKRMEEEATKLFARFGVAIDPTRPVCYLSPAEKQIVEISKAIYKNTRILIMDEPTAPLTNSEADRLLNIIKDLKDQGITILYITHRLDEVYRICDRVTVLRDGRKIATLPLHETTKQSLIKMMVGREIQTTERAESFATNDIMLDVQHMSGNGLRDISFQLHKGEILGFFGLVGAGRTELMRIIFGADRRVSGKIFKEGREIVISSPEAAMNHGVGLIPEDRKEQGCFLEMSVAWNIVVTSLKKISKALFVNTKAEQDLSGKFIKSMQIKAISSKQLVKNLSGGNQQKVSIAKMLAVNSDVLIFDEPTRGIDVGARYEIYQLMIDLVRQGKSIIMVSSDMEELIGMSDRVLVLCEKQLSGEVFKQDFARSRILEMASSLKGI